MGDPLTENKFVVLASHVVENSTGRFPVGKNPSNRRLERILPLKTDLNNWMGVRLLWRIPNLKRSTCGD